MDLHNQLLQVTVVLEDEVELPTGLAVAPAAVVRVQGSLLVQLGLDAADARQLLLLLHLLDVEVRVGQVELSPQGVVPSKGKETIGTGCAHTLQILLVFDGFP